MSALGPNAALKGGRHLGYIVPEWPGQTHAFFWRELQALRELGNEITVFSTRRPEPGSCIHSFAEEARKKCRYVYPPRPLVTLLTILRRPTSLMRAVLYIARLSEASWAHKLKLTALVACAADLQAHCEALGIEHLHVHSCADTAHIAALAECLGGPSYSLTLHGDLAVYGVDHRDKMKSARFVATVTRPLQQQVMDVTGLPASRVPVIPMGVDTDRFSPSAPARAGFGGFEVLTIARLNFTKGHTFALEAIARLRSGGVDVRYTIAGDGPYRGEIESEIGCLDLSESVRLVGSVDEAGVRDLLSRADAFVLSSFGAGEAAPVSVMEAMSMGLPVVCSRIGGTADMIEDGVNGILCEQRSVSAIHDALLAIATDQSLRRDLGARARQRAIEAFDYRSAAEKLDAAIWNFVTPRPIDLRGLPRK